MGGKEARRKRGPLVPNFPALMQLPWFHGYQGLLSEVFTRTSIITPSSMACGPIVPSIHLKCPIPQICFQFSSPFGVLFGFEHGIPTI